MHTEQESGNQRSGRVFRFLPLFLIAFGAPFLAGCGPSTEKAEMCQRIADAEYNFINSGSITPSARTNADTYITNRYNECMAASMEEVKESFKVAKDAEKYLLRRKGRE